MRYATFKWGKVWIIAKIEKTSSGYVFEVVHEHTTKKSALGSCYKLNQQLKNKGVIK